MDVLSLNSENRSFTATTKTVVSKDEHFLEITFDTRTKAI